MAAGDLSARADESKFQGAYRDIVHGLDALVDSVATPVSELTGTLERMAVNDYTRKVANNYSGVWDKLKKAVDLTLERLLHIEETTVKISNGDLSDLEVYRKIGKRSEKDQLVPAFTRMMDAIETLIEDTEMLAEESVNGKMSARADVAKHQGQYRKVVEGVNATLDAMVGPIKEADKCLQEMAQGNLDTEMKGDYKGDHAIIKENLNTTLEGPERDPEPGGYGGRPDSYRCPPGFRLQSVAVPGGNGVGQFPGRDCCINARSNIPDHIERRERHSGQSAGSVG
jgi:methyl-accepting chemotaxis protein